MSTEVDLQKRMREIVEAINNMFMSSIKLDTTKPNYEGVYFSYVTGDRILLISFKSLGDDFWNVGIELKFSFSWMRNLRINAFDAKSMQLRGTRLLSCDLLPDGTLDHGSLAGAFKVYSKGVDTVQFIIDFDDQVR